MATTQAPTIKNGVNVTQLVDTIGLIKGTPSLAKFSFRAETVWESGGRSRTRIESFAGAGQESKHAKAYELQGDEPPVLLGTDTAPNAVEAVLHAIGSCVAVGYAYNAAARGIDIEELRFESEGELDLHGFLGLSETVRPGFERIRFAATVKSSASREALEELCEYVQRTSPVLDIVRNPVPVTVTLRKA
ncbi:MAG TPA: OsmC family protein [Candidatus Limnocylindrales bacterium]|nr:OsmC family protein [Candidatus Limnocylindrales bacterium]